MVNKVFLTGYVGQDPTIRQTDNETKVAQLSLATSERYKDRSGEIKEQTEWHNIALWRHYAETVEKYIKKGSLIHVEGKLRTRSYDDNMGFKRYITEIVAERFVMLPSGKKDNTPPPIEADNDDLPF